MQLYGANQSEPCAEYINTKAYSTYFLIVSAIGRLLLSLRIPKYIHDKDLEYTCVLSYEAWYRHMFLFILGHCTLTISFDLYTSEWKGASKI